MTDLVRRIARLQGRKDALEERLSHLTTRLSDMESLSKDASEALAVVGAIAGEVQVEVEKALSGVVTSALRSVFGPKYEFHASFDNRRRNPTCTFSLSSGGAEMDPMEASGGGVVDVVAFALRVALLCMWAEPCRKTLVLDEPFRFVSEDLQESVARMMKQLSEDLGIQVLMVTHSPALAAAADRTFRVKKTKGITEVDNGL